MFVPLPLVFASESVTGSFLQLYHYLVYKVCISALRQQLIAVRKQGVKNIPSFKYQIAQSIIGILGSAFEIREAAGSRLCLRLPSFVLQ